MLLRQACKISDEEMGFSLHAVGRPPAISCCLPCHRASAAVVHALPADCTKAICCLQTTLLPADYIAVKNGYDHDWPLKQDDFFPYADCPTCYWTGTYLPSALIACVICRPALWHAVLVVEEKNCLPAAGVAVVSVPLQCVLSQHIAGWA